MVITALTRNQVVLTGSWVRIPPCPPNAVSTAHESRKVYYFAAFAFKTRKDALMKYLDSEFFEEFKSLDNLCRDIYGKSIDNKLGVTMYLEDMDRKTYQGSLMISGWTSDYRCLKSDEICETSWHTPPIHLKQIYAHRKTLTLFVLSEQEY